MGASLATFGKETFEGQERKAQRVNGKWGSETVTALCVDTLHHVLRDCKPLLDTSIHNRGSAPIFIGKKITEVHEASHHSSPRAGPI